MRYSSSSRIYVFFQFYHSAAYQLILLNYKQGNITSLNDIFEYVPKTVVAHDLGKKVVRFTKLMNTVKRFTLEELAIIGGFCGLEESDIFKLAEKEYYNQKKGIAQNAVKVRNK